MGIFEFSSSLNESVSFSDDSDGDDGTPCRGTWMAVVLWPCLGLLTSVSDILRTFVHIFPACVYYSYLESIFDPEAPFDGIPLYEAHPIAIPSQSSLPAPSENDSSEMNTSASSSVFAFGSGNGSPGGSGFVGFIKSGFFSAAFVWGSLMDL